MNNLTMAGLLLVCSPGELFHWPCVPYTFYFLFKGEVKAKIKISPVVVFGVLSRMVVVRGS